MGILVVGSVAFDSVKTPFGEKEEILGGTAVHFSMAASFFSNVSIVAVVGDDFPEEHIAFLEKKKIDISGLQRQKGRTFRWKGEYGADLNTARTLDTQLNVFADFSPTLMDSHRNCDYLFLGNIDPDLQRSVLEQTVRPKLVVCDTMNYWIDSKRESLLKTISQVDLLVINEAETRQLANEINIIAAARRILAWGPKILVIKRGEYGSLIISHDSAFGIPAFPVENVLDPTGAGDSFAGGLVGYLAASGVLNEAVLRKAAVFGTIMASFNVSGFGPFRLAEISYSDIEARFREFRRFCIFDDI